MIAILFVILLGYLFQINSFSRGWNKLPSFASTQEIEVSVLVAFRNEAQHLPQLLSDLQLQNYPLEKVQFIFVDDSSEDNSVDIIKSSSLPIELIHSKGEGKKAAIDCGIQKVNKGIVLTTDADCRLSEDWIRMMVSPFSEDNVQLVSGPVAYHQLDSLFKEFQALEFMSLIGSGAGAIGIQKAFMCNGANMAYRRSVFANSEKEIASGDDVFLLHHVKKNEGEIKFVKEPKATVLTEPKPSLSEFLSQRRRWASKASAYKDVSAQWVSLLVFATNVSFLVLLAKGLFLELAVFYSIKSVVDFVFLRKLSRFFQYNIPFYAFIILQLIYPFYIVWVGVSSQIGSYNWKGRKYKK